MFILYEAYLNEQMNDLNFSPALANEEELSASSSINQSLIGMSDLNHNIVRPSDLIKKQENERDIKYIQELSELSAHRQIKQIFWYITLPFLLMGALAWFFPYVYALLPLTNSAICLCQYFFYHELDLLF